MRNVKKRYEQTYLCLSDDRKPINLVTTAAELGHANATTTANIYAHQVARARAEAAGVRAGVFETLNRKERKAQ